MYLYLSAQYTHVYYMIHLFRCILKNTFAFFFFLDGSNGEVEKAPFIAKPVRLTPAWEANNLPNDELNFRGMD